MRETDMASYGQHLAVSTTLGVGYSATAIWAWGVEPAPAVLAGGLTALGGVLPDLDSDSGVPLRELFGFLAALSPLLLLGRVAKSAGSIEAAVLLGVAVYLAVRFGAAWCLKRLTVHRGMFHSVPAALIAAEVVYLVHPQSDPWPRLVPAVGVLIGFASHLALDELWSVQVRGVGVRLNRAAGSALKLFSSSATATLSTYVILLGLTYVICREQGVIEHVPWLAGATEAVDRLHEAAR
jgi:hypothetical protein